MALQWRNQLSVGNDAIDADHRHLINIINDAEVSLREKNLHKLGEVFEELMVYSNEHFAREESIANGVGYPKTDQLHASHGKLVVALDQMKEEIGSDWSDVAASHFTALLRSWLMEHVIKEDLLMKPWMIKHSPQFNPHARQALNKVEIHKEDPLVDEPALVDFDQDGSDAGKP